MQLNELHLTDAIVSAGLMRSRRVEVHPKVAGQPLGDVLQSLIPRLQDKQLKTDKIQNAENAIADMVSKGEAFAGVHSSYFYCTTSLCSTAESQQTLGILSVVPSLICEMCTALKACLLGICMLGVWGTGTEACIPDG